MVQASDTLELLLPGAPEPFLRRARNVVQFLRLLGADAGPARAASVGVGLEQARAELEMQDRARLGRALRDLLRHYLAARASSDTFVAWGEPALGHAEAWRVLDEFRGEHAWLPDVPGPRDSAARTLSRVLEAAERLGIEDDEILLWRSRTLRFTSGPRPAEALLRSGLESRHPSRDREWGGAGALGACLVECLLDRGALREARAWLQENAGCTAADPRLRQLLSWTLLCLGDYAGAKGAVVGAPVHAGILPASLAELRSERPEWLPCLAGRSSAPPDAEPLATPQGEVPRDRGDVGAVVLGVFAIGPAGQTVSVHVDTAPGLKSGLDAWLADRDGAFSVLGESEHELVVGGKAITVRKDGSTPIPGALGSDSTLALALAPILDEHGEVAGWLHLECEHHRLPSRERLGAMAEAWRADVLSRSSHAQGTALASAGKPGAILREADLHLASACAAVFEALVADLGIKTAQRKWWGFVLDGTEARLVATGGDGSGLSGTIGGKGRAMTRCAATRSRVSFDAPDARLSLDDKAGSGVVLPLTAGETLCGLLAIESSRRRDFREVDLARIAHLAQARGSALRIARFQVWHRRRFGFGVHFDARRPGFRDFAVRLLAAASSRSTVVFIGPGGSGKTILARWLHFESGHRDGPLLVSECETLQGREDLRRRLEEAREGSFVLEGLERLSPECQEELLRHLEGDEDSRDEAGGEVRILGTTRTGLTREPPARSLREDLAHRLDRVQIRLSALRERRGDILTLVAGFARRFAEEEAVRPPSFSDETLALLWRQPWEGNARELENLVYKLVVFGPGRRRGAAEIVEPEHVQEIAAQFALRLVRRLPSRHPSRADLLSALRITRKPGGRLNKTRAALYLGWDPDTLVARMQDAGIGEELAESSDDEGWRIDAVRALDEEETSSSQESRATSPQEARARSSEEARTRSSQEEGPGALHDAHGP